MKVAIILLTCNRPELTERVINQSLSNAYHPFDLVWVDNGSSVNSQEKVWDKLCETKDRIGDGCFTIKHPSNLGIAKGFNSGIDLAIEQGSDAVFLMSNDILMPDFWLREMVKAASAIPETGTIGCHCVEGLPEMEVRNGISIHVSTTAFGNVFIPRKAIDTVGGINPIFGVYGMEDADYAYRLRKKGFINYYLNGMISTHIGHDVGEETEYRKAKDEGLAKAGELWGKEIARYEAEENYTINMQQWGEEHEQSV